MQVRRLATVNHLVFKQEPANNVSQFHSVDFFIREGGGTQSSFLSPKMVSISIVGVPERRASFMSAEFRGLPPGATAFAHASLPVSPKTSTRLRSKVPSKIVQNLQTNDRFKSFKRGVGCEGCNSTKT